MSTKMYIRKHLKRGRESNEVENRHIIINIGCQVLREQLSMPMQTLYTAY